MAIPAFARRWRFLLWGFFGSVLLLATACGGSGDILGRPSATPTPIGKFKSSSDAGEAYLKLWQEGRYGQMYDLLSASSKAVIGAQAFVERYQNIVEEARVVSFAYQFTRSPDPNTVSLPFTATFTTRFFGDIEDRNTLSMVKEGEEWRVKWTPSLIFRGLEGSNLVHFFSKSARRGAIYDRNSLPLAIDALVHVIGIVPREIQDKEALVAALAEKLSVPAQDVRDTVDQQVPDYFFLPVKTLPYDTPPSEVEQFYQIPGVLVRDERQRVYPNGNMAAHTLGYMIEISSEQLKDLSDEGYQEGDLIGVAGLEASLEKELAGDKGGSLTIITPEGTVARVIAEKEPTSGQDVYTTLDARVQKLAEAQLGERVGSVVVMDPRDNSIMAMASYPRFDPNAFIRGLSESELQALQNNPNLPFLHRPALATYPPGSTFKVVTTAAGLEKGDYLPSDRFPCPPVWYGLGPDFPKRNWQSVDRGSLRLAEGLMTSCNPVFYQVALTLDGVGPDVLSEFARDFGLGAATGLRWLNEAAGVVPDPKWKVQKIGEQWFSGDSVNMGIGQGFLLVTPLQLANMYSAIASNGTLRTPLLVQKIVTQEKALGQEFQAQPLGQLPVSPSTLATIHEGLALVVSDPRGTSYNTFLGSPISISGKSGTAEDLAFGQDHVFFVAFAPRDDPRVIALVALEQGQSGAGDAGPVVRRIIEGYLLTSGN